MGTARYKTVYISECSILKNGFVVIPFAHSKVHLFKVMIQQLLVYLRVYDYRRNSNFITFSSKLQKGTLVFHVLW